MPVKRMMKTKVSKVHKAAQIKHIEANEQCWGDDRTLTESIQREARPYCNTWFAELHVFFNTAVCLSDTQPTWSTLCIIRAESQDNNYKYHHISIPRCIFHREVRSTTNKEALHEGMLAKSRATMTTVTMVT